MAGLSELDKRILAFEQSWWQFPGAKEREILETFGMPVTCSHLTRRSLQNQYPRPLVWVIRFLTVAWLEAMTSAMDGV